MTGRLLDHCHVGLPLFAFRNLFVSYTDVGHETDIFVIRLSLGRRLINLLPVAQRTNASHKSRRRQTMGRWSRVRMSRPP